MQDKEKQGYKRLDVNDPKAVEAYLSKRPLVRALVTFAYEVGVLWRGITGDPRFFGDVLPGGDKKE